MLSGLSTVIAPLYLSEVAPVNLRGAAGTINQFAIVVAVLVSEVLGLDNIMGNSNLWPYLLGLCIEIYLLSKLNIVFQT